MQEIINNVILIFNENPLAQSIGLLALLIEMIAILKKNDEKYVFILSIGLFFLGLHFLLMELFIVSTLCFLNVIRGFIILKYPRNIKLFLIFFILYFINAIYNYKDLTSMLAIFASFLSGYGFFFLTGKGIIFRFVMILVNLLRGSYYFLNKSIGGTMMEIIMLVLTLITIFRLYRDNKSSINLKKSELEV